MKRYWLVISGGLVTAVMLFLNAWSSGVRAQGNPGPKTNATSPRYNVISARAEVFIISICIMEKCGRLRHQIGWGRKNMCGLRLTHRIQKIDD